jgi:LysM repeat protein
VQIALLQKRYQVWLGDRKNYNSEFEILQLNEFWGMFARNISSIFDANNNCSTLVNEGSTSRREFIHHIVANNRNLEKLANERFDEFKNEMLLLNQQNQLFQNPAYVIRKGFDMQRIYDEIQRVNAEFIVATEYFKKEFAVSASYNEGNNVQQERCLSQLKLSTQSHYQKEPLEEGIKLFKQAIVLDRDISWQAYNGLAYMQLVKDSQGISDCDDHAQAAADAKKRFLEISYQALANLQFEIIPREEGQLIALVTNNITSLNSSLAVSIMFKIHVLSEIAKNIESNINITKNSLNNECEMIRIHNVLLIEQLANKSQVNITDFVGNIFSKDNVTLQSINSLKASHGEWNNTAQQETFSTLYLSGAIAIQVATYELDQDWSGTIFAAAIGAFGIFMGYGILTAATGPFATAFGFSMMLAGMNDVLSSIQSVINDKPINLDAFMKNKAFEMALNIVLSGISAAAGGPANFDALRGVKNGVGGITTSQFMMQQIAVQAALTGTFIAMQNLGNNYVKKDDGGLESDIQDMLNELLQKQDIIDKLQVLSAYDSINFKSNLNELYTELSNFVSKYNKATPRFETVAKSVASSGLRVFGNMHAMAATAVMSAYTVYDGMEKIDDLSNDFPDEFRNKLNAKYNQIKGFNQNQALQKILEYNFPGSDVEMMSILEKNHFKVEIQDCNKIGTYDLEKHEEKEEAIIKACEITKLKFSSLNKDLINAQLKQILLPTSVSIAKSKIVGGITNFVSNFLVTELVSKPIEKHFKDKNEQEKFMKAYQLLREKNDQAQEIKIKHQEPKADQPNGKQYKIKSGDTLSKIAKRNGITVAELLESNPQISDPEVIKAGTKIIMPISKVLVRHDNPPVHSKPANDNLCAASKGVCYGKAFGPPMANVYQQKIQEVYKRIDANSELSAKAKQAIKQELLEFEAKDIDQKIEYLKKLQHDTNPPKCNGCAHAYGIALKGAVLLYRGGAALEALEIAFISLGGASAIAYTISKFDSEIHQPFIKNKNPDYGKLKIVTNLYGEMKLIYPDGSYQSISQKDYNEIKNLHGKENILQQNSFVEYVIIGPTDVDGKLVTPIHENDNEVFYKKSKNSEPKESSYTKGSAAVGGMPDPDDFDPDEHRWNKNKDGKWEHPNANEIEGIHNRPNVVNERLRTQLEEIYRSTDKTPGGTAGALRNEVRYGLEQEHLIKAEERISNLNRIIKKETLSRQDLKVAERIIHDLREAIKFAKGE